MTDSNKIQKKAVSTEPSEDKTVAVTIDEDTYHLTLKAASELQSSLKESHNIVRGQPDETLTLAKCDTHLDLSKNPYHLQGEYGCHSGETANQNITELNLTELAWKPVFEDRQYGHSIEYVWVDGTSDLNGTRDEMMDITKYISTFICQRCQPTLEHWHTQRRIFLPKIADKVDLQSIDHDSFTHYDSEIGSCSICATPKSGIAELIIDPPYEASASKPTLFCPTCRDLLIESKKSLPFNELDYESHPLATKQQTPTRPYTDPNATVNSNGYTESSYPEDLLDEPLGDIGEMDRESFISFIRSLDGEAVTRWTGRNLFNHGFNSIADLYSASEAELRNTSMLSDMEAAQIKKNVENELKERYDKHRDTAQ